MSFFKGPVDIVVLIMVLTFMTVTKGSNSQTGLLAYNHRLKIKAKLI